MLNVRKLTAMKTLTDYVTKDRAANNRRLETRVFFFLAF